MKTPEVKHYRVLGVRIDALTMDEAATMITERAGDPAQPACYVAKPYVEFLDRGARDPHVRELLDRAWLSLPDAVSTQWATAYLAGRPGLDRVIKLGASIVFRPSAIRRPVPEKFGGTTFATKLLETAERRKLRVYLIGSPNHSDIATTARVIKERFPKLTIAGMWPGHLGGKHGEALSRALQNEPVERELVNDLQRQKPDLVFVGMGFPLQEELMAKLAPQLKHGVLIGEGGTFDYDVFGGGLRKAPAVLQRSGLEWLWRLILEPKRIRRQLAIPRFIWAVYRSSKR